MSKKREWVKFCTTGDGNCAFRAFAKALSQIDDPTTFQQLREEMAARVSVDVDLANAEMPVHYGIKAAPVVPQGRVEVNLLGESDEEEERKEPGEHLGPVALYDKIVHDYDYWPSLDEVVYVGMRHCLMPIVVTQDHITLAQPLRNPDALRFAQYFNQNRKDFYAVLLENEGGHYNLLGLKSEQGTRYLLDYKDIDADIRRQWEKLALEPKSKLTRLRKAPTLEDCPPIPGSKSWDPKEGVLFRFSTTKSTAYAQVLEDTKFTQRKRITARQNILVRFLCGLPPIVDQFLVALLLRYFHHGFVHVQLLLPVGYFDLAQRQGFDFAGIEGTPAVDMLESLADEIKREHPFAPELYLFGRRVSGAPISVKKQ